MLTILKTFLTNKCLTESIPVSNEEVLITEELKAKFARLGKKSLFIREIDAGSTNDCESEITALENPIYDLSRFGIKIVASPRHADILMVTGPVTPGMKVALVKAFEACPDPKIVIAVGDGAVTGRISENIAGHNLLKVSDCIPVDINIVGDPPSPLEIATQLLTILKNA